MKLLHAHSPSRSPPWSSRLRPRPPTLCVARLWTTRPQLALDCFSVLSRAVVGTRPRVPARLRLQRRRPTPRLPPAMLRITSLPRHRCVREGRGGLLFLGGGIEALSCSSRAFSASSAARCCRHLSRHTGQTPSRPSRGAGGGSVGILRPVPLGVHPPFPRNAGDGGTGILCAVPWGVLIPFPRGAGNCSTGVLQPGPWSVLPPPSLSGCD